MVAIYLRLLLDHRALVSKLAGYTGIRPFLFNTAWL
jgi:hypothetical protein